MSKNILGDQPSQLPILTRPRPPETLDAYIRRLATANHLPPSHLRKYLCTPPDYVGSIRADRLALLTGRTIADLTRAFPTLPPTPRPRRTAETAVNQAQAGLFEAIRQDAETSGLMDTLDAGLRLLCAKFSIEPATVLRALALPFAQPRQRRAKPPMNTPCLDHLRGPIDAMMARQPPVTIMQIWERLVDVHGADVSYATVRDYVRHKRLPSQRRPPARPPNGSD